MKRITNGSRFRTDISLALGLIWTSAAVGDGPLFPGAQYAGGDTIYSVAIGDLNGDKVPDLALANWNSDNVSVLLGVGDGTFAAATGYAAGFGPYSVAIGDLDGDQAPDLAVADNSYYTDNIVSVLLHQIPGLFDCNGNLILDACDIDCGPAAGACDLPGCGQSADCNVNGLPDECEEFCEGDANCDGAVDPLDSGFVLARFGCPVGTGDPTCDAADQNGDRSVDPLDVGFVLARFGLCP